jgi:hypothetical protein
MKVFAWHAGGLIFFAFLTAIDVLLVQSLVLRKPGAKKPYVNMLYIFEYLYVFKVWGSREKCVMYCHYLEEKCYVMVFRVIGCSGAGNLEGQAMTPG